MANVSLPPHHHRCLRHPTPTPPRPQVLPAPRRRSARRLALTPTTKDEVADGVPGHDEEGGGQPWQPRRRRRQPTHCLAMAEKEAGSLGRHDRGWRLARRPAVAEKEVACPGGHRRWLCPKSRERGKEELGLETEENEFLYERVRWAPSRPNLSGRVGPSHFRVVLVPGFHVEVAAQALPVHCVGLARGTIPAVLSRARVVFSWLCPRRPSGSCPFGHIWPLG